MSQVLVGFQKAIWRGVAVTGLVALLGISGASAQTGAAEQKPAANAPASAADLARESQKKTDEFAEAQRVINGPAGNPECVWLGRRVVSLMWRDDLDTAFRHLDLYDRFGCPGGHVQATFRCLTRFGGQIDPKVPGSINGLIHACWINPDAQVQAAATGAPAAATPAAAPPAPAPQPEAKPAAETPK